MILSHPVCKAAAAAAAEPTQKMRNSTAATSAAASVSVTSQMVRPRPKGPSCVVSCDPLSKLFIPFLMEILSWRLYYVYQCWFKVLWSPIESSSRIPSPDAPLVSRDHHPGLPVTGFLALKKNPKL